jgi:hypothetical protein
MKKSTKRVHEEDDQEEVMQREIAELNRLKQIKNRKYSWQCSQPIEVTLYLTLYRVRHFCVKDIDAIHTMGHLFIMNVLIKTTISMSKPKTSTPFPTMDHLFRINVPIKITISKSKPKTLTPFILVIHF